MTSYDVSGLGSQVLGIAGMGIGIGVLAHTAKNVMQMTDSMYKTPKRKQSYRIKPIKIQPIRLKSNYWK